MDARYAANMQKRFSREPRKPTISFDANKQSIKLNISKKKVSTEKEEKTMRRERKGESGASNMKTTTLFSAAKSHWITKMFWLNHVWKMRNTLIGIWHLNNSSCHLIDLHEFWSLPLVLRAQTHFIFPFVATTTFIPLFHIRKTKLLCSILFIVRLRNSVSWSRLKEAHYMYFRCFFHFDLYINKSTVIHNCCSFLVAFKENCAK